MNLTLLERKKLSKLESSHFSGMDYKGNSLYFSRTDGVVINFKKCILVSIHILPSSQK